MTIVDEIKSYVSVTEVAARYTEVRRRGRLHVCRCLCGENTDRNPSFTLYDHDNHYHCFACSRHGSVIDLVMLAEGLDFRSAVDRLRREYLPSLTDDHVPARSIRPAIWCRKHQGFGYDRGRDSVGGVREDVLAVMNVAAEHYHGALLSTPHALAYLHRRGLTDDTIRAMRIGYAGGHLSRALFVECLAERHDLNLSLLAPIGLVSRRGERLCGRIVFPVLDPRGRAVWMIGRAIAEGRTPKYDGLPDGLVHKRPMVQGQPQRGALLVEGAVDFAAALQWGAHWSWLVVALLGTAHGATVEEVANRVGLGQPVLMLLDQDKPGKEAAFKAALALAARGLRPYVVMDADRHAHTTSALRFDAGSTADDATTTCRTTRQREYELVQAITSRGFAQWVRWGDVVKDPGDLLALGECGRRLFEEVVDIETR